MVDKQPSDQLPPSSAAAAAEAIADVTAKMQASVAEVEAALPEPENKKRRLRPSAAGLRRRARKRHLVLAIVLLVVFVGAVVWSSRVIQQNREVGPLEIAPGALFEDLCNETAKNQASKLHVTDFEINDAMIPPIRDLHCIETLIIDQGILTDRSINTIVALPKLRHLRLRLSPITDEGLMTLAQCESLWYINLPHAKCTPKGIASLAQLPHLRQLRIGAPDLGNEVTDSIAEIETLRGIHLIGIAVTDEGLKTLAGMPNLESLYLDDSAVTEAGWEWIFKNHPELHVHIDQKHHDRDPQAHLHRD